MSDLDDKEDYQIHRNAWVKDHGTKRGFNSHNYKRYGFANEAGLRRHIGRREDTNTKVNSFNKKNIRSKFNDITNNGDTNRQATRTSHQNVSSLTDLEINRISYGDISPTRLISALSHDDWIDKYIRYDYFTDDKELIAEIKAQWRLEYLTGMRQALWDKEEIQVWFPRGYGKTETVLALYIRWFLEIMLPLYIVAPAYNHNKSILRRMVAMIKSPSIRREYGDVIGVVSFDKEMLSLTYHQEIEYINLDAPLSMVTWNSAKEGPHPAWLVFDDCMQKEYKNIESNEDIKYKYSKTFSKMRTRRGTFRTKVSVIGTRYGMEDMYSYFRDVQKIPVIHHRALEDDQTTWLYCPNYTLDDLLIEREKDVAAFETSMNNNPIPSSGIFFKSEDWKTVDPIDCLTCKFIHSPLLHETNIQYYCAIDPARGMSDSADNTAILVIAIWKGKAYIVDGYIGKADTDKILSEYDHFYSKYPLVWTLVEKTFAQIDLNRFNKYRGIIPYTDTVKRAKYMRIDAMKPYYTDGMIIALNGIQPYAFIYNEYLSYNQTESTASRKDDGIDCLSMIIQQAGQYLEKYIETQFDYSQIDSFHLNVEG